MKTILAVKNCASKGKSETLRELVQLLEKTYPIHQVKLLEPNRLPITGDFSFVAIMNGKTIAIESKGDPTTDLTKRLKEIEKNYNPDIIICATRTSGETVSGVKSFEKKGYQVIWTSTYEVAANHKLVNQIKASHILELLKGLQLI